MVISDDTSPNMRNVKLRESYFPTCVLLPCCRCSLCVMSCKATIARENEYLWKYGNWCFCSMKTIPSDGNKWHTLVYLRRYVFSTYRPIRFRRYSNSVLLQIKHGAGNVHWVFWEYDCWRGSISKVRQAVNCISSLFVIRRTDSICPILV